MPNFPPPDPFIAGLLQEAWNYYRNRYLGLDEFYYRMVSETTNFVQEMKEKSISFIAQYDSR